MSKCLEKAMISLFAYVGSLCCGLVCHAASLYWDFNDNVLPVGWYLAGDMSFANGRVQVGSGTISSQLNLSGNTRTTIEYDTGFDVTANRSSALIGASVSGSNAGGNSGLGITVEGYNGIPWAYVTANTITDTDFAISGTQLPAGSSGYHVTATVYGGKVSYSLRDLASGNSVAVTSASAANFQLSGAGSIGVSGSAYSGANAWVDNLRLTTDAPQTYGLFVGVHDKDFANNGKGPDLRGDLAATQMAAAFQAQGVIASAPLVADLTMSQSISVQSVVGALEVIRSKMKPGDSLLLYFASHGGSVDTPNAGNGAEWLRLGPDEASSLFDFQLQEELARFDPSMRKQIFIDACRSGGFWASGDPFEQFKNLSDGDPANTALFASASESSSMYYSAAGMPFFSQALLNALKLGLTKGPVVALKDYLSVETLLLAAEVGRLQQPIYEGGLGDAIQFDPNLFQLTNFSTSDYDSSQSILAVPEAPPWSLLAAGVLFTTLAARRRCATGI